jgi:hypothetical protein
MGLAHGPLVDLVLEDNVEDLLEFALALARASLKELGAVDGLGVTLADLEGRVFASRIRRNKIALLGALISEVGTADGLVVH